MATLPSISTLSYGSFTFPVEHQTDVKVQPQYDPADRTIIYDRYSITVHADIIADGSLGFGGLSTNDATLLQIQRTLTQPAQPFYMSGKDFSTIDIPNVHKNVRWGPKPRMLSWKPIANQ